MFLGCEENVARKFTLLERELEFTVLQALDLSTWHEGGQRNAHMWDPKMEHRRALAPILQLQESQKAWS